MIPRLRSRVDDNQRDITQTLRQLNISVAITSKLGDGFPDLVLGYDGHNYLIELKDFKKPKSQKKLTDCEAQFLRVWQGQYAVCETLSDILKAIGYVATVDKIRSL